MYFRTRTQLVLSRLDFGINRSALAPVPTAETGANAHRLMRPTQILNVDRELGMLHTRKPRACEYEYDYHFIEYEYDLAARICGDRQAESELATS